ncbi:MAG: alanine racemase [Chromatiales bacterium]
MTRPARAVINLAAARANLQRARELAPGARVMAVLKADAYGHGLTRMAEAFADADAFGVACLEEAIALRKSGVARPIVLLEGPFSAQEVAEIRRYWTDTAVHSEEQLAMIERQSGPATLDVWLKIDTGMHRLGIPPESVPETWRRLRACPAVRQPVRLMTHLASAQERGQPSVVEQLRIFAAATAGLPGERCIANSAGLMAWAEARADWVRPGLMLYGVSPFADSTAAEEGLQPVMTLASALIAVRELRAGETVGYGATWRCPENMPVGVVAIGYGDGYPRHAASGTPLLVNDRRAALIGRPSMDMLTVDLRNVPDARVGDPVVLWGEELPVEEVARHADTIPYALLCGVRMRVHFEVVDSSQAPMMKHGVAGR